MWGLTWWTVSVVYVVVVGGVTMKWARAARDGEEAAGYLTTRGVFYLIEALLNLAALAVAAANVPPGEAAPIGTPAKLFVLGRVSMVIGSSILLLWMVRIVGGRKRGA
jgi:hypothetical protein